MATLFTLAAPMSGSTHSILNGKVFTIRQNSDTDHLLFTDCATRDVILETTSLVNKVDLGTKMIIKTSSGTEFILLKVEYLIPTAVVETPVAEIKVEEAPSNFEAVSEEHIFRHIDYGDGYDGSVYHFDRRVSYDEFVSFCKRKNLRMADEIDVAKPWYVDYPLVVRGAMKSGSRIGYDEMHAGKEDSMVWTYMVVRPYTD